MWQYLPQRQLRTLIHRFATKEAAKFKLGSPEFYLWRVRRLKAVAVFEKRFGGDSVFSKDTRERMFVLSSISTNKTVTENWIRLNCEEASNKVIHPTSKSDAAGSVRDK